ncbi:MAG: CPBP family intramembrane metalloprotease [Clostridiales bacterium]|nr:CPBP family intramembrane metalloprotease [Clostridiales bacterium]
MDKIVHLKRLIIYVVLAFALAWGYEFIFIGNGFVWNMNDPDSLKLISLVSLGMLAPAIAHILARVFTKEGFKPAGNDSMMLGINLDDGKWKVFLFAILIPLVYSALADLLLCLSTPGVFDTNVLPDSGMQNSMALLIPIGAVFNGVIVSFAAFGEEFGWRAYMMPKLKSFMGKYPALIVGGIIWGIWHAPLTCVGHNFGTDYPGFPYVGIILMCLYCILLGGILTYVTEKTGSVWPAVFLHGVNNASPSILTAFMNADKLSQVSLFKHIVCTLIPFVLILLILKFRNMKKSEVKKE